MGLLLLCFGLCLFWGCRLRWDLERGFRTGGSEMSCVCFFDETFVSGERGSCAASKRVRLCETRPLNDEFEMSLVAVR